MVSTRLLDWAKGIRDREADFAALLDEQRVWICKLALKIVGSREEAEDVVQTTLLQAWRRHRSLQDKEKLQGWLRQIVVRTSLNRLRAQKRTPALSEEQALFPSDEESVMVRMTLSHMKPDQRAILALAIGERLSYREIAEALDIPEGTVSSRLNSAKSTFRKLWEEH
jgi:RNA polymerase sigma-70 factor, ECF subfamily